MGWVLEPWIRCQHPVPAAVGELVVCRDMKLHSTLLGWIGFLTKPCVSPQVFHGSMRLSGGGRVAITARGVEPSRKCSKPGSLKPGDALESEDMVKVTERS